MPVPSFIPGGSIVSLTPPLPAPGHKIPTSIAFIQVVGRPLDILFFQNWPDQIDEGLTSAWAQFNFSPATAPLAFQYEGTQWDHGQGWSTERGWWRRGVYPEGHREQHESQGAPVRNYCRRGALVAVGPNGRQTQGRTNERGHWRGCRS